MESTPQENAALVRGFLTDVIVGGDTDAVDVAIEEVVATEEAVAVRATVAGTHRESPMDLAPTGPLLRDGRRVGLPDRRGHVGEIWSLPDGPDPVEQLGVAHRNPRTTRRSNGPGSTDYDQHETHRT